MQKFQIIVTDGDASDLAGTYYYSQDDNRTPQEIVDTINRAIASNHYLAFTHGSNYITISPCDDDEGYYYNIYESRTAYDNEDESIDGGQCTGTLSDAIEMAIN